jgi:hypothetical protein
MPAPNDQHYGVIIAGARCTGAARPLTCHLPNAFVARRWR